jgi:hypothetical protein
MAAKKHASRRGGPRKQLEMLMEAFGQRAGIPFPCGVPFLTFGEGRVNRSASGCGRP